MPIRRLPPTTSAAWRPGRSRRIMGGFRREPRHNPMPPDLAHGLLSPTFPAIAAALIAGNQRDFSSDARALVQTLKPILRVPAAPPVLPPGPLVVAVNHYARPGFHAMWIALAVSSCTDRPIRWVITNEWTATSGLCQWVIPPASRWVLRRIASCYGFLAMPPMPPRDQDTQARALAVRKILAYMVSDQEPTLGLAPEGQESPTAELQRPPPGSGRFIKHLAGCGAAFLPVGVFETKGKLCVAFGRLLVLDPSTPAGPGLDAPAELVMQAIADLLPTELRGPYA